MLNETDKIQLHCTDRDKWVSAYLLDRVDGKYLNVALNTVKLHMPYTKGTGGGFYAGTMASMEFVVKEDDLPAVWDSRDVKGRRS